MTLRNVSATATTCFGSDSSQFPSSNLFAAAGDGVWVLGFRGLDSIRLALGSALELLKSVLDGSGDWEIAAKVRKRIDLLGQSSKTYRSSGSKFDKIAAKVRKRIDLLSLQVVTGKSQRHGSSIPMTLGSLRGCLGGFDLGL